MSIGTTRTAERFAYRSHRYQAIWIEDVEAPIRVFHAHRKPASPAAAMTVRIALGWLFTLVLAFVLGAAYSRRR
jgi:hypothetical protein